MPRTFPHRRSDRTGFTLLEALIAMLVAVVITLAAGSALIGSLRAESAAAHAIEHEFAAQRQVTRFYLAQPITNAVNSESEALVDKKRVTWRDLRPDASSPALFIRVSERPARPE